jgi:hypothetical protein
MRTASVQPWSSSNPAPQPQHSDFDRLPDRPGGGPGSVWVHWLSQESRRRYTYAGHPRRTASQPVPRNSSTGNALSVHLSSCRQTTSGFDVLTQASRFASRRFTSFTLNVAIFRICCGPTLAARALAGVFLVGVVADVDLPVTERGAGAGDTERSSNRRAS